MHPDISYQAKAIPMAKLLYGASHGNFSCIPEGYAEYFQHEYEDGDVSLLGHLSKFSLEEGALENWELSEVLESLSKVDPTLWPSKNSIEKIDLKAVFNGDYDGDYGVDSHEFVEDNLGTSDKVQRVLAAALKSVFKNEIESIRDRSGNFPSSRNNFLLEKDGTFSGTFKSGPFSFLFEVLPTEGGWICTYRMDEKSLDSLERKRLDENEEGKKKKFKERRVRNRGW